MTNKNKKKCDCNSVDNKISNEKMNAFINKIIEEISSQQPIKLNTEINLTGTTSSFYRALQVARDVYGIGGINLDNEIFELGVNEMMHRIWASYSLAFLKGQTTNIDDDGKLKN